MFLSTVKRFKDFSQKDPAMAFLLVFCVFLPFQFALNPAKGYDLAIIRILIPVAFTLLLLFKLKNKENVFFANKLTILILVFLFLAVLSVALSQNFFWSLRKLFFLLTIFPAYFFSTFLLDTFEKKRAVIFAFVIGATILSWLAIAQFFSQFIFGINKVYDFMGSAIAPFFLGNSFSGSVLAYPSWLVNAEGTTYMRAFAIFPDPHMLSYYLGMLFPWSIALWADSKTHRVWLFIAMFSLFLADILTFTRGGYIALIAGAIVAMPLVSKKTAIKILLSVGFVFFLFSIAPHNPVAGRLASSFDAQEGSNQARLGNFEQAITIIKAHPFGVGIGAYSLAVKPTADYREPIYAHNAYLDITAELGIPAVLIFIAILFFAFQSFWRTSKSNPFFIAGVSSLTIFSVHSLVENPLYSVHILTLFLIILALSGVKRNIGFLKK